MDKLIFGVDCDGVIRDFNRMLTQFYNVHLGIDNVPAWIDPDFECPEYELFTGDCYNNEAIQYVWENKRLELMIFAKPYNGYLGFLRKIKNRLVDNFNWEPDIKFITHQYTKKAEDATKIWFNRYKLGMFGELIFSHGDDKWKYTDLLIDDKIENLYHLRDNKPDGIPICCARNWNKNIDSNIFRGSYDEIIKYLDKTIFVYEKTPIKFGNESSDLPDIFNLMIEVTKNRQEIEMIHT